MASSSEDDEFGDFNFLTSAGTKNQAEFKAKTPIRRERESSNSSSSSSLELASDEETTENHEISIIQVSTNTSRGRRRKSGTRGGPRRKSRARSSNKEDSIILIDEEETGSKFVQDVFEEEKTIKVLWKYEILRISVPKGGKISDLSERISSKVSVPSDNILLFLNDSLLHKDSSVDDIKVIHIVSAYQGTAAESYLELKVQRGNSRQSSTTTVKVKESDTVGQLLDAYISVVKDDDIKKEKGLSLMFDGEVLKEEDLLKDLDLEGGECFDLVVPKTSISTSEPVKEVEIVKSKPPTRRSRRRK